MRVLTFHEDSQGHSRPVRGRLEGFHWRWCNGGGGGGGGGGVAVLVMVRVMVVVVVLVRVLAPVLAGLVSVVASVWCQW